MTAEQASAVTHDAGEWFEHKAGPCPVDRRALVKVQMRFELELGRDEAQQSRRAGAWDTHWEHKGDTTLDVIAYRLAGA